VSPNPVEGDPAPDRASRGSAGPGGDPATGGPRRGPVRRVFGALFSVAWWGVKIGLLLAGAVGVAVLSGLWTVDRSFQESEVVVPDVVGLDVDEASRALSEANLELRVEARRPHDTVEEGHVFYQEPLAGQSSRRGRQVAVVLSAGPGRIPVPDLAGQSPRAAVLALRQRGLEIGDVIRVHEARAKAGDIFAQDPPAGTPVRENAKVHVLASLGPWPRTYVMPDLRGRPLSRVEVLLAAVGIRVADVRQQVTPGQPEGLVQAQLPPPGTPVSTDAAVSLVVSRAVERPVPGSRRGARLSTE